jgi:hypothetical protein
MRKKDEYWMHEKDIAAIWAYTAAIFAFAYLFYIVLFI